MKSLKKRMSIDVDEPIDPGESEYLCMDFVFKGKMCSVYFHLRGRNDGKYTYDLDTIAFNTERDYLVALGDDIEECVSYDGTTLLAADTDKLLLLSEEEIPDDSSLLTLSSDRWPRGCEAIVVSCTPHDEGVYMIELEPGELSVKRQLLVVQYIDPWLKRWTNYP